ncbi:hypothetical protein [Mucilaginibacter sp. HD30]
MKDEKDLFYEIENVLHAHEDAYVPGAWEGFVKKKKRRPGLVYLRLVAAASVLLFLGYAAWLFKPSTPVDKEKNQTKNTTKPPYIYPETNPAHDSLAINQPVVPQKSGSGKATAPSLLTTPLPPGFPEQNLNRKVVKDAVAGVTKTDGNQKPVGTTNIAELLKLKTDSTAVANAINASKNTADQFVVIKDVPVVVKAEPKRYERGAQRLNYDSLADLNKPKPFAADKKKDKILSYALMVSPSVGNQKMNFGTGVEVAYNINKSFSVSSGIAYAYVNAGSNRNALPGDATRNYSLQGYNASYASPSQSLSSTSTQSVKDVKLALSGLEIPLSFQYKTKGGFFVSAGVSAMSVIGNDLSYNLISNHAVSSSSANGLANAISVVTEETTAKSNEKIAGYVGFYTLSAGKKINFGRGKLNFAPFIKIPFSGVSSENIQLMHGGVQLGFGF